MARKKQSLTIAAKAATKQATNTLDGTTEKLMNAARNEEETGTDANIIVVITLNTRKKSKPRNDRTTQRIQGCPFKIANIAERSKSFLMQKLEKEDR